MPELPEVETVKRGLRPFCHKQQINQVIVRQPKLRWPIPNDIADQLTGHTIESIDRRGKYLLLKLDYGLTLFIHLGMSGVIRVVEPSTALIKHDHVDIVLSNNMVLRYNDPRRFGAILYTDQPIENHILLKTLGPEPLSDSFSGEMIYQNTRKRKLPIKTWLMHSHNVVGVGNIYANEALFLSKLHPEKLALQLTKAQCDKLAQTVKQVLTKAIEAGGTTLKDFKNTQGSPGYFKQKLFAYGRTNKPCLICGETLQSLRLGGRQTVFCPQCQPT